MRCQTPIITIICWKRCEEMIDDCLDKSLCCGCGGCEQICPVHCISMESDEMGFLYPHVDEASCIGCGQCEKVCPVLHDENKVELSCKVYECRSKDEEVLRKSSSGGVFYGLAKHVIEQGGVVFGAAFDENWKVSHTYADNLADLEALCRSKYAQSRMGDAYVQAAEFLKKGRTVLFAGTPCQAAGVKNYMRVLTARGGLPQSACQRLITADFVCGSIWSPLVFERYLDELREQNHSDIIEFYCRDKEGMKWSDYGTTVRFANGGVHKRIGPEDYYKMGAFGKLYTRPSCFQCKYKGMNSGSDLTMGDMWYDKQKYKPEEEKGFSLLILKTEKGKELFRSVSHEYVHRRIGLEDMKEKDHLWAQHREHPRAEEFRRRFVSRQYDTLEQLVWSCLPVSGREELEDRQRKYGVFGGWNTRETLRRLVDDRGRNKLTYHVCRSSLISLYAPTVSEETLIDRGNAFRYDSVRLDFNKNYRLHMQEYLKQTDILLVDFIEERFDLLYDKSSGSLVTDSDAFRECAELSQRGDCRFEPSGFTEEERMERWKSSCLGWIEDLSECLKPRQIVLMKQFLAEKKGHNGSIVEEYERELLEIRKINGRLEECYAFFEEQLPGIHVLELTDNRLCYTDLMHRYGCIPSHLNKEAYDHLAGQLLDVIVRQ